MANGIDSSDPTPAAPEEAPVTLAEHREQFPTRTRNTSLPTAERPAPPPAPAPPKHRAKSQKAGPEDVEEIARLTKELRDTESAIAIDRKPGESQRVFELRRRTEIAKRAKGPAAPAASAAPAPVRAPEVPTSALPEYPEPEPPFSQFADQPDPYAAHVRAVAAWDRRKERWQEQTTQQFQARWAKEQAWNQEIKHGMDAHMTRVQTYEKENPDVGALFNTEKAKPEAEQIQLTLAMRGAIEFHERGPEMVVTLLKNPDLADELFLLTNGRMVGDPRTDPLVATVRRRLLQRVAAVTTGAAPSSRSPVAPHPPTPVRTAPSTPREKPSAAATGSLREHLQRFPPPRRH